VYADGNHGLAGGTSFTRRRAVGNGWSMIARGCVALLVVGVLCGLVAANGQGVGHPYFLDGPEYQVLIGINQFRAHHGLRPLRASRALTNAANEHSRDMVRRRYYAHNTRNGSSWNRRIKHYVRASIVGETLDLLYGPRGRDPDASIVVRDWEHSPAHRAVLLAPQLHRVGVARAARRHGRPAVFTADFAS
jgi:uncharacterized protein YkwD